MASIQEARDLATPVYVQPLEPSPGPLQRASSLSPDIIFGQPLATWITLWRSYAQYQLSTKTRQVLASQEDPRREPWCESEPTFPELRLPPFSTLPATRNPPIRARSCSILLSTHLELYLVPMNSR